MPRLKSKLFRVSVGVENRALTVSEMNERVKQALDTFQVKKVLVISVASSHSLLIAWGKHRGGDYGGVDS